MLARLIEPGAAFQHALYIGQGQQCTSPSEQAKQLRALLGKRESRERSTRLLKLLRASSKNGTTGTQ